MVPVSGLGRGKKTSERKILCFFTPLNLCGKETGKWSMSYLIEQETNNDQYPLLGLLSPQFVTRTGTFPRLLVNT